MKNAMPVILLTGFEPFGGEATNPSWEAVRALNGARIGGHRIVARCLPVTFGDSLKTLRSLLRELKPVLVIAVGQAGGRAQLSLERVAINIIDARIADNASAQPIDVPVVADAPAAYFTTLPIKAMLAALREAGIPAEISQTAGTFVCNQVMYGLLHELHKRKGTRGGFIHIPYAPEQAAQRTAAPSLAVPSVSAALRLCVRVALRTNQDVSLGAGATE